MNRLTIKEFAPAIIILLAVAVCRADDPPKPTPPTAPVASAVVTPAGPIQPGTFVRIDATASVADTVLWDTDLDPATYQVDSNSLKVTLAAPLTPGTYSFRLDAFKINDGKLAAARVKPSFTVIGTIKPVDPNVAPVGPVGPISPTGDDRMGLTSATRAIIQPLTWDATSLTWRQAVLANVFSNQASLAASYSSPQAMVSGTVAALKDACGANYPNWSATVLKGIDAKIDALRVSGQIVTTADLAEAFTEISKALKEAPLARR